MGTWEFDQEIRGGKGGGYVDGSEEADQPKHRLYYAPTMFKQSVPTHGMPIPRNLEQAARFKRAKEHAAQIESPMEILRSASTLTVDSLWALCADEIVFLQYKTED